MGIPEVLQNLPPDAQNQLAEATVKAVNKLGTAIGKAFGYFLEPGHRVKMAKADSEKTKLEADAEAYKMKSIADATAYQIETVSAALKTNVDLPIKYDGKQNVFDIDISNPELLLQRADIRQNYQKMRKELNLQNVIHGAYLELGDKTVENSEEIDSDWMTRFLNIAEDISDEQLQSLWSKILAGEILKPKTYSYRILEFLRNISKNELNSLLKILPFIVNDYVPKYDKILEKYGISYSLILELDELGVLNSSTMIGKSFVFAPKQSNELLLNTDDIICLLTNKSDKKIEISFPIFAVSAIGRKLPTLTNTSINKNFIKDVIEEFSKQNSTVKVSVHRVESIEGTAISYEHSPLYVFNGDQNDK